MLKRLWSLPLEHAPRGIALAREATRLLVWDTQWLFWTNRDGQRQAQSRGTEAMVAAAVSEDGTAFAAARSNGHLAWLGPDLLPRWEKVLPAPATALAFDALGIVIAVADSRGKMQIFDADAQRIQEWTCPRPAKYLTFEPQSGRVIAAADLGWLAVFDTEREEPVWRDTPFVNIAGVAATVTGSRTALACFSDGLRVYDDGKLQKTELAVPPCKLLAVNHDGTRTVTVGMDGTLFGFGTKGGPVFTHRPQSTPVAIALSPLADRLYVATADRLKALDLKDGWERSESAGRAEPRR